MRKVRLDQAPVESRVSATILKQLLDAWEHENRGAPIAQAEKELQVVYDVCMGWEIGTSRDSESWRRATSVLQPVPVGLSADVVR